MTSPPDTAPLRQIIIGVSCYADATRALPMAAIVARWVGADLRGILVEADVLFTNAGAPTARLVTPGGMARASPTVPEQRRFLAADAHAFQAELAKRAEAILRAWTFEQRSGDIITQLRRLATHDDIVMIGHHGFYRQHGAVILIHCPGQTPQLTHEIAAELARDLKSALFICAVSSDPEQQRLTSMELEALLQTFSIPGSFAQVFGSTAAMLDRINRTSTAVVIVDIENGPFRTDSDLVMLRDVARCPIVVVGSSALLQLAKQDAAR